MTKKPWFKVGQRVRLSKYGINSRLYAGSKRSGVVTKVDERNSPTVLWDGRKTADKYYAGFIEPDRRRPAKRTQARKRGE